MRTERSWQLPLQWSSLEGPKHSEKDSDFVPVVDVVCSVAQAPEVDSEVVVGPSAFADSHIGILDGLFATARDQAKATAHGVYAAENLRCIAVPDLGTGVGVGESDMASMQGQASGRDVRPVPALL